jgi:ectoine hydroxylase-related dioxygenase (phytanoyl-CoA dioxygenase family)
MTTTFTDLRTQYAEQGYVIARGAIDADLAAETFDHVQWLIQKYPDTRPEQFHHQLLVIDPFMHRLVGDERLLDIAEQFIGPNIALFAAHYIAKPPLDGQKVLWHQDGSYWPLEPMEVVTLWVAGSDSTVENGCMRVLPGTQNARLLSRAEMQTVDDGQNVLSSGIHPSQIDDTEVVELELKAGDVSIHNPRIIHGSNPNTSDKWRVGLTLRYIPTTTLVKNGDHANVLLRGDATPGVNNLYVERPRYVPGETMPFKGCEAWM